MKKRLPLFAFVTLGFLALSSPSEARFQQRLAEDYGSIHSGLSLNFDELKEIGSSRYQSYVFFSRYEYTFGTIGVRYFGISFMTFYMGSNRIKKSDNQEKEIIS